MSLATRLVTAALLFASLDGWSQHYRFVVLKEGTLEERLRQAHPKTAERFRRLHRLFEETGCAADHLREQKVKGSRHPNLICSVDASAEGARRIVVGAHFDSVGGSGVIDNWSGAVLLPSLAQAARMGERRHSFEFVGFAAEEDGLLGSRAYVKALGKEERRQIDAVLVLDSLGLSATKCWPNGSSESLVSAALAVARALNLDFSGVNVDRVGTTDSAPFKSARIPVLSLHSLTQETLDLINGPRDQWAAVRWKDYYDTHRLISALLVYLDQKLP